MQPLFLYPLAFIGLAAVPGVTGVNNHQGSESTSNPPLMNELMRVLHEHKLFYIDSRTTAATVAFDAARHAGVPAAYRNVPWGVAWPRMRELLGIVIARAV